MRACRAADISLSRSHSQPSSVLASPDVPLSLHGSSLEPWQLDSLVDWGVRGTPTLTVGAQKGARRRPRSPPTAMNNFFFSRIWKVLCPNTIISSIDLKVPYFVSLSMEMLFKAGEPDENLWFKFRWGAEDPGQRLGYSEI